MSFSQKISKIKKLLDEDESLLKDTRTSVAEANKKIHDGYAVLKDQR